ncbi:nicotinate-nucleotide--dimethylbenzimidazole phosphoribosyltransferase, partial [Escherichia coli]|nr:nicotinate-nucleotide--dimethylbenzimidazole phosphoribosyltransferase [Escherichia coli]
TTSSTALLAALTNHKVEELVGSGTGITSQQLKHKIERIEQALADRQYDVKDPIDILSAFGGLEIAGMVGAMLAAASYRIPIIVDGFI